MSDATFSVDGAAYTNPTFIWPSGSSHALARQFTKRGTALYVWLPGVMERDFASRQSAWHESHREFRDTYYLTLNAGLVATLSLNFGRIAASVSITRAFQRFSFSSWTGAARVLFGIPIPQ